MYAYLSQFVRFTIFEAGCPAVFSHLSYGSLQLLLNSIHFSSHQLIPVIKHCIKFSLLLKLVQKVFI